MSWDSAAELSCVALGPSRRQPRVQAVRRTGIGDAAAGPNTWREDRSITRVRHTLSCFLGKHDYEKLADRDGCHEYVCTQCGHPLLFEAEHDPYAASPTFKKKVRYLCGLFGHRARHVATRNGYQEYACFCGHSFLKTGRSVSRQDPPSRDLRRLRATSSTS